MTNPTIYSYEKNTLTVGDTVFYGEFLNDELIIKKYKILEMDKQYFNFPKIKIDTNKWVESSDVCNIESNVIRELNHRLRTNYNKKIKCNDNNVKSKRSEIDKLKLEIEEYRKEKKELRNILNKKLNLLK
jgi:hypothetical protein